jgi:hypothetical protein
LVQDGSITSETLEQLNIIGQLFCLRSSSKERVQVEESTEVKDLFEYSRNIMDKLGFVQAIYPPANKKHYDIAIIFGGYQFRVEDRTLFWLELQKQGYSFTRVAFLGGARSLDPKQDAEALVALLQQVPDHRVVELQQEPLNEYDMMLHVYHKLQPKDIVSPYSESMFKFNTDAVLSALLYKQQTPKRKRDTYVLSYIGKQGTVDFLNGAGLIVQGIDRPTTASTVEDYLAFLAKQGINLQNALSVCTISMQPHVLYQAAVAEGLFPSNFTIYPAGAALDKTNTSDLVDNFARYVHTVFSNLTPHKL